MNLVVFGLLAQHIRIGCTELCLVEGISELLATFLNLFIHLILNLGEIVLDQNIGAISLLGILIVDKRVVECAHVTGSLPNLRMHKDAGIDSNDILVKADHSVPPILLDIVLKFRTHLAVIINGSETIINLA